MFLYSDPSALSFHYPAPEQIGTEWVSFDDAEISGAKQASEHREYVTPSDRFHRKSPPRLSSEDIALRTLGR
jgi:hypothetical protein